MPVPAQPGRVQDHDEAVHVALGRPLDPAATSSGERCDLRVGEHVERPIARSRGSWQPRRRGATDRRGRVSEPPIHVIRSASSTRSAEAGHGRRPVDPVDLVDRRRGRGGRSGQGIRDGFDRGRHSNAVPAVSPAARGHGHDDGGDEHGERTWRAHVPTVSARIPSGPATLGVDQTAHSWCEATRRP